MKKSLNKLSSESPFKFPEIILYNILKRSECFILFFSEIIIHKCLYHSSKKKLYQFGIILLVSIYNHIVWIFDWLHDYICYANSHSSSKLLLSFSCLYSIFGWKWKWCWEIKLQQWTQNLNVLVVRKKNMKDKIGLEKFL